MMRALRSPGPYVFTLTFIVVFQSSMVQAGYQFESASKSTRHEIQTLNLMNGLLLLPDQLPSLLSLNHAAQNAFRSYNSELALMEHEFTPVLGTLRDTLRQADEPDQNQRETIHRMTEQAQHIQENFWKELNNLAHQVLAMLQDYQIEQLEAFKPCLIPPKRTGGLPLIGSAQVQEHPRLVEMLSRIQALPDRVFERQFNHILEKYEGSLKRHYSSSLDLYGQQQKLIKILRRIRLMTDIEFEVEKEVLAQALIPDEKFLKRQPDDQPIEKKIIAFLLDPAAEKFLKERITAMSETK